MSVVNKGAEYFYLDDGGPWSQHFPNYEERMKAMANAVATGLALEAADQLELVK